MLPQNKAILATQENLELYKKKKKEIIVEYEMQKLAAIDKIKNISYLVMIKKSSDHGILYDSVTYKDILVSLNMKGIVANIIIPSKIKKIGIYDILIYFNKNIEKKVKIYICRSRNEVVKLI